MRICLLTSVHPPFDIRIFQKEARSLANAGHDVTLVAPHDGDELVDGIKLRGIARVNGRLARMLWAPVGVLREAMRARAEVYHFHDPELLPVGVVLKLLGRRVVYDVHENVPQDVREKSYLPRPLAAALAKIIDVVERFCARTFDLVVVVDESIAVRFAGRSSVVVVRNYPQRASFAGRPPAEVSRTDGLRGIYIGVLTPDRGGIQMVRAIERVAADREFRLSIVGRIWPESHAQEIRELPGSRCVEFGGTVPYGAVPELLARAHVGLVCFQPLPNNVNGGPTKLFEYMASGLPVVASDFPRWRDIVEGNACGICVDPTDPEAIARALYRLIDDPELRATMGANGRRAVMERYNWEAEAEVLLNAYAHLQALSLAAQAGPIAPSSASKRDLGSGR